MLSVLIPNYNNPCLKLVADLHAQLEASGVPYEIIVAEDGSTLHLEENARMTQLSHVKYLPRTENIGRFKIRQFLPTQAQYPYLLCMDSDAEVVRPDYIQKYADLALSGVRAVIVGGKTSIEPAPSAEYALRYTYEIRRENIVGRLRGLSTFNYMVPAEALHRVGFSPEEEKLFEGYGYEDSILGILFARGGYPVQSIDNPLRHLGLETSAQTLRNFTLAGRNLLRFHSTGRYPELLRESKLLRLYLRLKRLHLAGLFKAVYRLFARPIERNLLGPAPSLRLFDLYRLNQMLTAGF